jgi:hypothetical protein
MQIWSSCRTITSCQPEKVKHITALMTVVNGKVVYASGKYAAQNPAIPEVIPAWSPVKHFGGYQK